MNNVLNKKNWEDTNGPYQFVPNIKSLTSKSSNI